MDHLLSTSNGKGGGVEGYPRVSTKLKLRETLEKDYDKIKKVKEMKGNKKSEV